MSSRSIAFSKSNKSMSLSKRHTRKSTLLELQREAFERKKLLKMTNKQLIKQCKKYKVAYSRNKKKETLNKLIAAMKKQRKSKKKKKKHQRNQSSFSLMQSITNEESFDDNDDHEFSITIEYAESDAGSERTQSARSYISFSDTESFKNGMNTIDNIGGTMTILENIPENKDEYETQQQQIANSEKLFLSSSHSNTSSITSIGSLCVSAIAPKMIYEINGLHSFDTIKDMKQKLPMNQIEPDQCKMFYNGFELNDDDTLSQLKIVKGCTVKMLLSWNYFRADLNMPHVSEIEYEHLNKVGDMRKLNDLKEFKYIIGNILSDMYDIIQENIIRILHSYCVCLSGKRTFDRNWNALHSLCYDYPNDIRRVEKLLMEQDLYIDAYPHSGYDTPLRLAINRANVKETLKKRVNKKNAKGVVELVEFLLSNGARRMIRQTVVNLKRTINDQLYSDMDEMVRKELIDILEPHVDEDPFKPLMGLN
eukprot:58029_1